MTDAPSYYARFADLVNRVGGREYALDIDHGDAQMEHYQRGHHELSLEELGDAINRGEREPSEAVTRLKAALIYPRFLGIDDGGSYVWELSDGRWTFAEDPDHAVRMTRTFEPDRYVGKYGVPTPHVGVKR